MKGIDVSENNGYVDFDAVKNAGYDFVIVRVGYGVSGTEDEYFLRNVTAAHEAGLQVGAYWYSYALDVDGARREAEHCRRIIDESGVFLELPVFFDFEDADGYKDRHGFAFDPQVCTDMCSAFVNNIGLNCGVYTSVSWFNSYVDWRSIGCSIWNAEWMNGYDPEPNTDYDDLKGYMWQYTDAAIIDGKQFDANVIY